MPFSRTTGVKIWECPDCGHITRTVLAPRAGWRIRCGSGKCLAVFLRGEVLYRPTKGRHDPPPDTIMPVARMPNGKQVHQVLESKEELGELAPEPANVEYAANVP